MRLGLKSIGGVFLIAIRIMDLTSVSLLNNNYTE